MACGICGQPALSVGHGPGQSLGVLTVDWGALQPLGSPLQGLELSLALGGGDWTEWKGSAVCAALDLVTFPFKDSGNPVSAPAVCARPFSSVS